MGLRERFHTLHTRNLNLDCNFCHTQAQLTYSDPLAQVFFVPVDKRACLSCHKEGGAQPFFGEDWQKANVQP